MLGAVNLLRGSVEVEVEGAFPERFLNVCSQNGIAFWGLQRMDETHLRAHILPQGYKKVQHFAEKCLCTVVPVQKKGVPFFLWRLRRRHLLFLGFGACILALYILSMFIWEFEVVGNETVSDGEILENLAEIGVKMGTYGPSIDINEIKNEMILRVEELSWLTVNVKGSRAVVEVRERIPKPELIPDGSPCNIVSARDGVVVSIDTLSGAAVVRIGQTVEKGDLLVSGVVDSKAGARFVHARADIEARVWYDYSAKLPQNAAAKQYTGRTTTRRALVVGGSRINFYGNDFNSYRYYDKIVRNTILRLPGGAALPVILVTEEYREYTPADYRIPEETAKGILLARLETRLAREMGQGEVVDAQYVPQAGAGFFAVRLVAECREKIDVQIPLQAAE